MAKLNDFNTNTLSDEGVDMHLLDPNFEEMYLDDDTRTKPVNIRLLGKDSERFLKKQRQLTERRIQRSRGQRANKLPSVEETLAEQCELLAAVTLGWNIEEGDGPVPFSEAKARDIYMRYPWIREQVDEFVGSRANFLKKGSNGSNGTHTDSSISRERYQGDSKSLTETTSNNSNGHDQESHAQS